MGAIKQIFEDDKGVMSNMRVMSFLALLTGMFYTLYPLIARNEPATFENLLVWIIGAFCPKVVQKFAESRLPKEGSP